MFSKQSLEQRKLRVDRARERLREKRLKRMEAAKLAAEEEGVDAVEERPSKSRLA